MNDLRFALRQLFQNPTFTIIATLTLALGIGANSAIFSVVDAVLLRPLPYPNPEQLVMIWGASARGANADQTDSFPDFYDYREKSQSFSAMAAYSGAGTVLSGVGEAQELRGVAVNGDFFEAIGMQPMLGRGFTAEEAKAGQPSVVVLGHGLWKRAFGSNPKIIGQQINLAGRNYTVLGVMPPRWRFPINAETSEFIMPLEPTRPERSAATWLAFPEIVCPHKARPFRKASGGGNEADCRAPGAAVSRHEHRLLG